MPTKYTGRVEKKGMKKIHVALQNRQKDNQKSHGQMNRKKKTS